MDLNTGRLWVQIHILGPCLTKVDGRNIFKAKANLRLKWKISFDFMETIKVSEEGFQPNSDQNI